MVKRESEAYQNFLGEISRCIQSRQFKALKAVNKELIELYLEIGEMIVLKQQQLGWGRSVVESLAEDLRISFPGLSGFSASNLWRMRSFFIDYQGNEKLAPLVREIGWTHNRIIFEKCKTPEEREFYLRMTHKFGWTKVVLIHQIEGKSFEKYLLNQTNFDSTLPEKYKNQAKLAIKDEYSFGFLGLAETHSEKELETKLIANIRTFLIELGSDFAYLGNQFRVVVDDDEFFIDLLLFHRRLRSLVAIELKTTKFKPDFAGQMQFYLTALDEKVKTEDENPSIGIIICREKKRTVVEYTLRKLHSPIGIATYSIGEELPEEYEKYLPSPEEIAEKLNHLFESQSDSEV